MTSLGMLWKSLGPDFCGSAETEAGMETGKAMTGHCTLRSCVYSPGGAGAFAQAIVTGTILYSSGSGT